MSTDRGTMTRGESSNGQQPPWAEPTLPAGRRLPSAPRERKPLLVVLALLLIVVGAGAAGLLVTRMNHEVGAVEVSQTVQQGSQFTAGDLTEVQVPNGATFGFVSWSDVSAVVKSFAAEKITAGTLLTEGMAAGNNGAPAGQQEVGLALKDGQLPPGLQIGQTIEIYSTQTSATGCPGGPGAQLATGAKVLSISGSNEGAGVTDVEIALDPESAGDVACNTANGTAAIAITGNG